MNGKLIICYTASGYMITDENGDYLDFPEATTGIRDLKDAIKICIDHDYRFEVVG